MSPKSVKYAYRSLDGSLGLQLPQAGQAHRRVTQVLHHRMQGPPPGSRARGRHHHGASRNPIPHLHTKMLSSQNLLQQTNHRIRKQWVPNHLHRNHRPTQTPPNQVHKAVARVQNKTAHQRALATPCLQREPVSLEVPYLGVY